MTTLNDLFEAALDEADKSYKEELLDKVLSVENADLDRLMRDDDRILEAVMEHFDEEIKDQNETVIRDEIEHVRDRVREFGLHVIENALAHVKGEEGTPLGSIEHWPLVLIKPGTDGEPIYLGEGSHEEDDDVLDPAFVVQTITEPEQIEWLRTCAMSWYERHSRVDDQAARLHALGFDLCAGRSYDGVAIPFAIYARVGTHDPVVQLLYTACQDGDEVERAIREIEQARVAEARAAVLAAVKTRAERIGFVVEVNHPWLTGTRPFVIGKHIAGRLAIMDGYDSIEAVQLALGHVEQSMGLTPEADRFGHLELDRPYPEEAVTRPPAIQPPQG